MEPPAREHAINVIGYCLGGTLLAATLAYMAATGDDRVASATYFTTMVDFEEPGDEDVFRKVRRDFDAKSIDVSDHQIRREMEDLMQVAVEQVSGKKE